MSICDLIMKMFTICLLLVSSSFADESKPTTGNDSQGLVGHWTFDGDLCDVSGYGHHGKFSSPVFAPDRHGSKNGAWQGNGRSSSVNVADSEEFDVQDSLTIAAWIKLANYVDAKGDHSMIISKWFGANAPRQPVDNGQYFLTLGEDGRLIFLWADYDLGPKVENIKDSVASETVIPKNEWIHVAVTFHKGQATLYVGGRRDISKQSEITSFTQKEYRHDDLRIGAHLSTAGQPKYIFNGAIDDVRFYNRPLSDDEISALANESPVDETLNYYLSKSALVVEGEITDVTEDNAKVHVSEVLHGRRNAPDELSVRILRREQTSKILTGSKWILFLKPATEARNPTKWQTVDPWFGATPHSTALVESLRQLRDAEAEKTIAIKWAPQLRRMGIGWDQTSVSKYLERIHVPIDIEDNVAELIQQLDSDSFRDREEAQKQLLALGTLARPALSRTAENGSFEAKARASAILEAPSVTQNDATLSSLMRITALRPTKESVRLLVGILPHCVSQNLATTAREVLVDVSTPADLPFLKRTIEEVGPQAQSILVHVCANGLGPSRAGEVYHLLENKNAKVRFATARALLDLGDRKSLSVLIDLLDDDDNDLNRRAAATLRATTGESFGFDERLSPEKKREAVEAWREWLAKHGENASLRFPIQLPDEIVIAGLVLHYTFSSDGQQIQDRSGHGNHGRIHGDPVRVAGVIGDALSFDGKDDFIDCGNNKSVNFGVGDFTVAVWFNASVKEDLQYSYGPFINKGAPGSQRPARPGYGIYQTIEHGKPILRWDFGQRSHEARARVISDKWESNRWNHMVLIRRGDAIESYLNGNRIHEQIQKATSDATVSGPEHLLLGKMVGNSGASHLFTGMLDDVRVYNRSLSENEIETLFQMGNTEKRSD